MPRISLFKKEEITAFDSPPVLTEKERKVIFTISETDNRKIYFRKKTSKVGFVLQLGYFKAHKKFFTPEQYLVADVEYVSKLVGTRRTLDLTSENYTSYLKHLLYTFKTNRRKQYEKKGFVLLPSKGKVIDDKLLKSQWDNILRLLCTIKLRESKASEILARLSSYSKQHPLYRALKELGRIYKTIFLLRYLTETPLRQAITKQSNKVELSHDFANAVFFARNREFKVATKDEQQIALSCRHLIQNSIILWNYLSISDKLSRVDDKSEYENLLDTIKEQFCYDLAAYKYAWRV